VDRRQFLAAIPALTAARAASQAGPPVRDPVEQMTAAVAPRIALTHLGFRPGAAKALVVRNTVADPPTQCTVLDVGTMHPVMTPRLQPIESDFGRALVAEFSDLRRPGMYQVTVGDERSVPFFIREDVWRRTLPAAIGYYRYQRCGVDVPGVHPACHLDDARRRDTGEHVDVVGGWHDAGDLRKWMDVTMLNGIALLQYIRHNPAPRPGDVSHEQVLEEVRHGNIYFLKMQDRDGKLWHDAGGGVNGDNSDNHWTDNVVGSADDRYINVSKTPVISAVFSALQALVAQSHRTTDPHYAKDCLDAGERAWRAWRPPTDVEGHNTVTLAWWTVAACELHRATAKAEYADSAARLADRLVSTQVTAAFADQHDVRGFWPTGGREDGAADPLVNIVYSAMPAHALLDAYEMLPRAGGSARWLAAARTYVDEYVTPLSSRNAYRVIPAGIFIGSPTPETYRPLAGRLTYRYFLPVRKQFWWQGANCHLAQHALLLGRLARIVPSSAAAYTSLAYRQLGWILGANPFGASLMTGEGARNPYPHSRFVGLIPGGILNGIAGNEWDEPVLDQQNGLDWRTNEYWSPHVAFYIWANSVLEEG
jgi:glycosyl hydrolase family 9/cellulase-like Ig domain-containing protein